MLGKAAINGVNYDVIQVINHADKCQDILLKHKETGEEVLIEYTPNERGLTGWREQ